ncbi:hypothetical protein [Cellulomonas gilvus]|uniref:hypothetical protein n=1 Tax=Cellulomonas gilvus TaxID=11 RepID=UPI0012377A25|nr:hypothetical protein [Cellulomonas gilvus]
MVQTVALGAQHESFPVASPPQQPPSLVTAWSVSSVSCAVLAVVMVVVAWQQPIGSLLRGVAGEVRVGAVSSGLDALAVRWARGADANAHHHRCRSLKYRSLADQGSMKIPGPVAGPPTMRE